jgi:hypothetical protein
MSRVSWKFRQIVQFQASIDPAALATSHDPAAYAQLRCALQVHLRDVGDLIEMGLANAAATALARARAIEAELDLRSNGR